MIISVVFIPEEPNYCLHGYDIRIICVYLRTIKTSVFIRVHLWTIALIRLYVSSGTIKKAAEKAAFLYLVSHNNYLLA